MFKEDKKPKIKMDKFSSLFTWTTHKLFGNNDRNAAYFESMINESADVRKFADEFCSNKWFVFDKKETQRDVLLLINKLSPNTDLNIDLYLKSICEHEKGFVIIMHALNLLYQCTSTATEDLSILLLIYMFAGYYPQTQFWIASNYNLWISPNIRKQKKELKIILQAVCEYPNRMYVLAQMPVFSVSLDSKNPFSEKSKPGADNTQWEIYNAYMFAQSDRVTLKSIKTREKYGIHHNFAYRLMLLISFYREGYLRCNTKCPQNSKRFFEIMSNLHATEMIQKICYMVFGHDELWIPDSAKKRIVNPLLYYYSPETK